MKRTLINWYDDMQLTKDMQGSPVQHTNGQACSKGDIHDHTWYLSILGHHHTIKACKRGRIISYDHDLHWNQDFSKTMMQCNFNGDYGEQNDVG